MSKISLKNILKKTFKKKKTKKTKKITKKVVLKNKKNLIKLNGAILKQKIN